MFSRAKMEKKREKSWYNINLNWLVVKMKGDQVDGAADKNV